MKRLLVLSLLAALGAFVLAAWGGEGDDAAEPGPAVEELAHATNPDPPRGPAATGPSGPLGYPSLTPEQLANAYETGILAKPTADR